MIYSHTHRTRSYSWAVSPSVEVESAVLEKGLGSKERLLPPYEQRGSTTVVLFFVLLGASSPDAWSMIK